ncbi:hypothetical protein D3C81_1673150 [compost metagenome]
MRQSEQQDHGDRRTGRDDGKQRNRDAYHHGVDDQHLAITEMTEHTYRNQFHEHRCGCRRHHHQARLPGRQAEPELIQQRQQERQAADAQARDETADHRDAEGTRFEQRQLQQGMQGAACVQHIGTEQRERDDEQDGGGCGVQIMFAKDFQQP